MYNTSWNIGGPPVGEVLLENNLKPKCCCIYCGGSSTAALELRNQLVPLSELFSILDDFSSTLGLGVTKLFKDNLLWREMLVSQAATCYCQIREGEILNSARLLYTKEKVPNDCVQFYGPAISNILREASSGAGSSARRQRHVPCSNIESNESRRRRQTVPNLNRRARRPSTANVMLSMTCSSSDVGEDELVKQKQQQHVKNAPEPDETFDAEESGTEMESENNQGSAFSDGPSAAAHRRTSSPSLSPGENVTGDDVTLFALSMTTGNASMGQESFAASSPMAGGSHFPPVPQLAEAGSTSMEGGKITTPTRFASQGRFSGGERSNRVLSSKLRCCSKPATVGSKPGPCWGSGQERESPRLGLALAVRTKRSPSSSSLPTNEDSGGRRPTLTQDDSQFSMSITGGERPEMGGPSLTRNSARNSSWRRVCRKASGFRLFLHQTGYTKSNLDNGDHISKGPSLVSAPTEKTSARDGFHAPVTISIF